MDPLTSTAASGLRSRMESLDMLANNLANTETGGYKTEREFYSLFISPEAEGSATAQPMIERNWTDFSQGTLRATGNSLDLGLQGKGFFAVDGPSGPLYTRNGSFHISPGGKLVTPDGYPVRGDSRRPLALDPARPVEVTADGSIRQNGQSLGKLEVVDFDDSRGLVKQGNTYFRPEDPKSKPRAAAAEVHQGKLEGSNVGTSDSAVRLVNVMRQFEMLQRAVTIGVEMNRKAIEEVARVGS